MVWLLQEEVINDPTNSKHYWRFRCVLCGACCKEGEKVQLQLVCRKRIAIGNDCIAHATACKPVLDSSQLGWPTLAEVGCPAHNSPNPGKQV
jgi:hypothetical protein